MIQSPGLGSQPVGGGKTFDLVVIGAGPAGAHAALTAANAGLHVALLDEAPAAGGQVWRSPPAAFAPAQGWMQSPDASAGAAMRTRLAASRVETRFGRRVWNLRAGFEVHCVGPDGNEIYRAKAMILAPGTVERIVPFAGSTLPGVIGLGAATILLKSQGMLPGRRTIVAGAGPLLVAVAHSILKGGGEVAAIVDLNGPLDWLRALPAMRGRPDLVWQGAAWLRKIVASGVPYFARHALVEASGGAAVSGATIAPVDRDWRPIAGGPRRTIAADAVAVGHGLSPSTEMTRLLGVQHRYDAEFGEWVPVLGEDGSTSVPNLFVAGDAAGVSGAAAAIEAGKLAGRAAARALGAAGETEGVDARRLARSRDFGRAMTRLTRLRPGLVAAIAADTVVCRCEDVTRGELDAAAAAGAKAIGQLKAWTRCGMGPCQGRMCGETVGTLMALHGVPRETFGQMVARPPLRPVGIAALTGEFAYEDIALPPSLPTS